MIFEKIGIKEEQSAFLPYLNTGTIMDITNGRFYIGYDGKWYLDGGISVFTGVTGKPQTYKSAVAGSILSRCMNIYPSTEGVVFETENTVANKGRYDEFVDTPVSDRIQFYNVANMNLTDFYTVMKQISDYKIKNKKDFLVDSPFIDPATGKRKKMWIPTLSLIDSFSKAPTTKTENFSDDEKTKIDDTSLQTLYMHDGLLKSRFLSFLILLASKCGIYTIFTSHIGEKKDIGTNMPSPKQLQFMAQKDRLRNVGSEFEYLMTTLLQTKSASMLTAGAQRDRCKYGYKNLSPVNEVSEIEVVSVRGKSLGSGYKINYVCSQYEGILADVTNYHYLREMKKTEGQVLTEKGRGYQFPGNLLPDVTLTDSTVRETFKGNYEVRRGLELLTQLTFIHRHWPLFKCPDFISIPIDVFAEKIATSKSELVSDILNSTGNWSYAKQDRPYMSVFDVAELLTKDIKDTIPSKVKSK